MEYVCFKQITKQKTKNQCIFFHKICSIRFYELIRKMWTWWICTKTMDWKFIKITWTLPFRIKEVHIKTSVFQIQFKKGIILITWFWQVIVIKSLVQRLLSIIKMVINSLEGNWLYLYRFKIHISFCPIHSLLESFYSYHL